MKDKRNAKQKLWDDIKIKIGYVLFGFGLMILVPFIILLVVIELVFGTNIEDDITGYDDYGGHY